MLTPVRMSRLDCVFDHEKKDRLVRALQDAGITQIDFLGNDFLSKKDVSRDRPLENVAEVSNLMLRVRKITEVLGVFHKPKVSFLEEMLNIDKTPKVVVDEMPYEEFIRKTEETLSQAEKEVRELQDQLAGLDAEEKKLSEKLERYYPLRKLDVDAGYFGSSKLLYTVAGFLSRENYQALERRLNESFGGECLLLPLEESAGMTPAIVCVCKDGREQLTQILSGVYFEAVELEGSGLVSRMVDEVNVNLSAVRENKKQAKRSLERVYARRYTQLVVADELLSIEKQRCEVFTRCGSTKKTTFMRLWTPLEKCDEVESLIQRETEGVYSISADKNPSDAPTLLQNPKYIRSFEMLTKSYSPPAYNHIDPTIIIAPTFALFFGIMLSDAVYGVLVIAAALLLDRKYGNYSQTVRDFSTILKFGGVAGILVGLLTGSYLGDFIAKYLLGTDSQHIALWLDPLYGSNVLTSLVVVCSLGAMQLILGKLVGAYGCIRRREFKNALVSNLSLLVFLAGLSIFLSSQYPKSNPILPQTLSTVGLAFGLVGVVLLFLGYSVMFFFEIIGFVGNSLSYARLLALALTSSAMAVTFNFLAKMSLGVPYVGLLLAAGVFILGHILNILINVLGAFVHDLRLHYVEFFGTFYGSGGYEFKPFREERKYTTKQ